MRPPEFTGGNAGGGRDAGLVGGDRFNEAAGIHRRKPTGAERPPARPTWASMRPPEFTGGNSSQMSYLRVTLDLLQ